MHHFRYKPGYHAVDTKLNRVENLVSKSVGVRVCHCVRRLLPAGGDDVARGVGVSGHGWRERSCGNKSVRWEQR